MKGSARANLCPLRALWCACVSVSLWSRSAAQLGSWSKLQEGSNPLQKCFVPSDGQEWVKKVSSRLTVKTGVAPHGCSGPQQGRGTSPQLKNLLMQRSFQDKYMLEMYEIMLEMLKKCHRWRGRKHTRGGSNHTAVNPQLKYSPQCCEKNAMPL